jgi:CheY-like chemotaxis protein
MMVDCSIVVVDDNIGDFILIKYSLDQIGFKPDLLHFETGDGALSYLYETKKKPSFIILDQNMPGKDGWDVLEAIRTSDALKDIKVAIFTSSATPTQSKSTFSPDKYLIKPIVWEEYESLIQNLVNEWVK